jgi:hypothetical protein
MMTIMKLFPFLAIAVVVVGADSRQGHTDKMEAVKERLTQRRRDLQQQGPLSKEEADYMKKLISKRALRVANTPEDLKAVNDALFATNPFAKALNKRGGKPRNGRPDRGGGRRTNERGASSSNLRDRDLGETTRRGSKKSGSNKSNNGGSGYVSNELD